MHFTTATSLPAVVAILTLLAPVTVAEPDGRNARLPKARVHHLPPLREQAKLVDGWTAERAAGIPDMLERRGVDAWLMSQREYAEETTFWALKPFVAFSARRRTTSLFISSGLAARNNVSSASASDGDGGEQSKKPLSYTWIDNTPDLWQHLTQVLEDHNPSTIAVNAHPELSFASGLHAGELETMKKGLGEKWSQRLLTGKDSERMLAVEFIGTMVDGRLGWYKKMMETSWAIIDEAFSSEVIEPGVTTPDDVVWWMREKIQSLNYTTWFQPAINIVTLFDFNPNATHDTPHSSFPAHSVNPNRPIQYGDVLHTDFGVTALGLNTDTQHLAYVVPPRHIQSAEKTDKIIKSLHEGLWKANKMQDIVTSHMEIGVTGDEILRRSRAEMEKQGIEGKIYCHATGEWGHSAGTVIGMTNLQEGVPVIGELPLLKNTYYSIELYAEHYVPELDQTLNFYQEEDVFWNGKTETWDWVHGRQDEFILIKYEGEEDVAGEL